MMIRLINHDTLKKKEKPAGEITVYISSCLAASQDSPKGTRKCCWEEGHLEYTA